MYLLAAAQGLPLNVVPAHKTRCGPPKRMPPTTERFLNTFITKTRLSAAQVKEMRPDLLTNLFIRGIQHHLQKDIHVSSNVAALKLLLIPALRMKRLALGSETPSLDCGTV